MRDRRWSSVRRAVLRAASCSVLPEDVLDAGRRDAVAVRKFGNGGALTERRHQLVKVGLGEAVFNSPPAAGGSGRGDVGLVVPDDHDGRPPGVIGIGHDGARRGTRPGAIRNDLVWRCRARTPGALIPSDGAARHHHGGNPAERPISQAAAGARPMPGGAARSRHFGGRSSWICWGAMRERRCAPVGRVPPALLSVDGLSVKAPARQRVGKRGAGHAR